MPLASFRQGRRTFAFQDFAVTNEVTFDFDRGGAIVSWRRDGAELVDAGNPRRGIQAGLTWTDWEATGEFVRHTAVQGGDYLDGAGRVKFWRWNEQRKEMVVTVVPVELDPRGRDGVELVSSYHGPSSRWWKDLVFEIRYQFGESGQHNVRFAYSWAGASLQRRVAHFDVGMYLVCYPLLSELPDLIVYRPGLTNETIAGASTTPGPTIRGFQAHNRGYMLGVDKLKGDDEADDTSLAGAGLTSVTAAGANHALGFGGIVRDLDGFVLGDPTNPNAFRWQQNRSGVGNYLKIGVGQWLSSRIIDADAVRRMPARAALRCALLVGTDSSNKLVMNLGGQTL